VIPVALKVALAGVLLLGAACGVWKVQDWHYGKQLSELSAGCTADLSTISNAVTDQMRTEQDKRLTLEE
jgi:hypothetical protein